MANTIKFLTKNGLKTQNIDFSSPSEVNTIQVKMLDGGVLIFTGVSGQLFSISDSLTGTIFSVNDISGVPSIELDDTGVIRFAQYSGNVLFGTAVDNGIDKVQVNGTVSAISYSSTVATGTAPFTISSTTKVTNLYADRAALADNSTLVGGYAPNAAVSNNTVVLRNATGYIFGNYFNMTANVSATAASHIAIQNSSDNYLRWQTPAQFIVNHGLAGLLSPALTGTPTAPTAAVSTNTTQLATTAFVQAVKAADTGSAATAVALKTARTINGVSFNGTANITINAVDATARIAASEKGAINGIATLDSTGKVPAAQLPSYVDDVLEYANQAAFPVTGESDKLYVAISPDNQIFRWTGTVYVDISASAGNADTATKLATARTISATGDAAWSVSFDGSGNATAVMTIANSGVTAGTYKSVTVNAKGFVTGGTNPTTLSGYGITDAQATLVSGTNLKSINGVSLLGSGDLTISSGGTTIDPGVAVLAFGTPTGGWLKMDGSTYLQSSYSALYAKIGLIADNYSTPAATWTQRSLPTGYDWSSIATNGSIFVVVAPGVNTVATSTDGINWTTRTAPSGFWKSVAYLNGYFIAFAGGNTTVMKSSDGITWAYAGSLPTAFASNDIHIAGGLFYGVFYILVGCATKLFVSTDDGATWAVSTTTLNTYTINGIGYKAGTPKNEFCVSYSNSAYAAVTDNGGITWTSKYLGWYSLGLLATDQYFFLFTASTIYRYGSIITDTATSLSQPSTSCITGGTWTGSLIVAPISNTSFLVSPDNFATVASKITVSLPTYSPTYIRIAYKNNLFVAVNGSEKTVTANGAYSYDTATSFYVPNVPVTSLGLYTWVKT